VVCRQCCFIRYNQSLSLTARFSGPPDQRGTIWIYYRYIYFCDINYCRPLSAVACFFYQLNFSSIIQSRNYYRRYFQFVAALFSIFNRIFSRRHLSRWYENSIGLLSEGTWKIIRILSWRTCTRNRFSSFIKKPYPESSMEIYYFLYFRAIGFGRFSRISICTQWPF
jgi:hypothetical protein